MTIHDVLKLNITKLKEHNIEEPILKAKILLAFVLCKTKEYLLINQNEEINKDIIKIYETNIEKIINGFPIQYITNKKEFMGLDFFVNESVLIPRNDTEILVEESLNIIKKHNMHEILDLCTGSGAIAVSIAKNIENAKIIATDISEEALKIAEKNAMQNEVSKRILFKKSDMFNDIDCLFDLVISNPPYIEEKTIKKLSNEVQKEPQIALNGGKDGLKFYRIIANNEKKVLRKNGYLLLEIGYNQKNDVIKILDNSKYKNIYSKKDLEGNDRIIVCQN